MAEQPGVIQTSETAAAAATPISASNPVNRADEYPFAVTVGEVYDGPLDLLLDLIRKQDINIYDIPI